MIGLSPETTEHLLSRRQRYFRALAVHGTRQLIPLLQGADSGELRWIVRIVDLQLLEMPKRITDPQSLKRSMDDFRLKRSLVLSRLGHIEQYQREATANGPRRVDLSRPIKEARRKVLELARSVVRRLWYRVAADRDIYAAAKLYIQRFGETAPIEAAMRADEFGARNDFEEQRAWIRIMKAIEQLQRARAR